MLYFGIRFLICNFFICLFIIVIVGLKKLLKTYLSARIQYNLWFILLVLLAVPFLPVDTLRLRQALSLFGLPHEIRTSNADILSPAFLKDDETWVEPDISVICDSDKLSVRGCEGAPDWIIEIISPSTQSRDYLKKLWLYQNAGVREYWIVNPKTSSTTVYNFETGESGSYSFNEAITVGIFSGLNIVFTDLL